MAYTVNDFCTDSRSALKARPVGEALPEMAQYLARLLANPEFVRESFNEDMPPSQRTLYHDPELDFYVFAHIQVGGKKGKPHSHGASWAIYGNAKNITEMTEWRRTNPETDEHSELVVAAEYGLGPGQTKAYGPGVIHSTAHPEKAWVIRVTGTDLDKIPRYHFGKNDKMIERV